MTKEKNTQGMFDKLYSASKEVLKMSKKPLEERKLKRKIKSAYDDAINKEQEAEEALNIQREKLADMDINSVLDNLSKIRKTKETKRLLKEEYKVQFGKEMNVNED